MATQSMATIVSGVKRIPFKRWQITFYSPSFESLSFVESPNPPIERSHNETCIQVVSSSLNPIDIAISKGYGDIGLSLLHRTKNNLCRGDYGSVTRDRFPIVLGRDFSGYINGTNHQVFGVVNGEESLGSHSSFTLSSLLAEKPKNITFEEAAAIPYAGLTSLSALTLWTGMNPIDYNRKNVLVIGATGGVGSISVQLLKSWGSSVTSVARDDNGVDWIRHNLNSDEVIGADELNLLPSESYDLILDCGPNRSSAPDGVDSTMKCLLNKRNGLYVTLSPPLLNNWDKRGIMMGSMQSMCNIITGFPMIRWGFFTPSLTGLNYLKSLIEENKLKPIVGQKVPFNQLKQLYLNDKENTSLKVRGKTVITGCNE